MLLYIILYYHGNRSYHSNKQLQWIHTVLHKVLIYKLVYFITTVIMKQAGHDGKWRDTEVFKLDLLNIAINSQLEI